MNPLRVYVFEDGLVRFATVPYEEPNYRNRNNIYMHLTNYAINKMSPSYKQNETMDGSGESHKRSLKSTYKKLKEMGYNIENMSE